MINLNTYITEKLHLNKDIKISPLDEITDKDDNITKDFRKLYKMLHDDCGDGPYLDSLVAMSDFEDNYSTFYYKFDKNKWFYFLRDVVNYDLISLGSQGEINVQGSNHKDIAKLIKKWNRLDIAKKVYDSFR